MMASAIARPPVPGLLLGHYPERLDAARRARPGALPSVRDVRRHEARIEALSGDTFVAARQRLRSRLLREGLQPGPTAAALAMACVVFRRELGLRLYDTQLLAAGIVLGGRLAEMATGEGKTCAVTLAVAVTAMAGIPVHVITANDYLVTRDAQAMRPVYDALGLSVGSATQAMQADARRRAFACDVTYCTAKDLVFDYLRDGLVRRRDPALAHLDALCDPSKPEPVLRGLCMAIVDEADSILIDEARMPLILAKPVDNAQELAHLTQALELARPLREGVHFRRDAQAHACELTDEGQRCVAQAATARPGGEFGPLWRSALHRDSAIRTALVALHAFQRDRDYLVVDGQVVVVDPTTGRIAAGRAWSLGLHQAIELKEGCSPSAPQVSAAQITFQRFFARYLRLGGVSGTLAEARAELRAVYGLSVQAVPLHRPSRRRNGRTRLFRDRASLWPAVAARARALVRQGRPVLIGTDSVEDSEALSRHLERGGVSHAVLNARHDAAEAAIVANAGRRGAITVATNMAGRGTDIPLDDDARERGGLHVICCQVNAARRIDRQLAGRCARQHDPGSVEAWLPLDAALLADGLPAWLRRRLARHAPALPGWLARAMVAWVQRSTERRHAAQRARLLEQDRALDRRLSSGTS